VIYQTDYDKTEFKKINSDIILVTSSQLCHWKASSNWRPKNLPNISG